ncbi:MAG: ferrous iron transporter B [Candidatus Binatia bacterium]|nr:ferrous iron transporter B [Candidatus Binatia bacterium]
MSAAPALTPSLVRVALVGAPNAGKTTLFNALTGSSAHVGNYPGVTVERREGILTGSGGAVEILDLPGTYALHGETPDEQVVTHVLAGDQEGERLPDALVVVVDSTTLRRGLGLVREALDRGLPTLVVATMIDEVKARGGQLDPMKLSRVLGVHVLGVVGHRGVGLDPLRRFLEDPTSWPQASGPKPETAPARFAWVDRVCDEIGTDSLHPDSRTDMLDRVLLHPVTGIAIFLGVMVLLFQSIFAWAVPAMDAIDTSFAELGRVSREVLPAGLLTDLWADGILAGVGSVVIFLPQILILFTFLHFLQDVGYMSRAAFVVDRVMGWVGLQGRSFVPLLSCYACAVPGIMAARTIASPRERLATILVAPFMTCSARLPVYTLLIAAFVPATAFGPLGLQGLVMFGLYLLGAFTAFASAAALNRTLLKGSVSVFYMELPPYRMPTLKLISRQVWESASAFLKRAGTIILIASIVLWGLLTFPSAPIDPSLTPTEQASADLEASVAGRVGHAIEPAIAPLGFDWKIGVGLLASLAAREVIVSTLAQIYAVGGEDDFDGLRSALVSDLDPRTGQRAFTLPTALSLMVFFVFALQCTSTIAIMARETGTWRWPALAFGYMLGLAWVGSFVTYHLARAFV